MYTELTILVHHIGFYCSDKNSQSVQSSPLSTSGWLHVLKLGGYKLNYEIKFGPEIHHSLFTVNGNVGTMLFLEFCNHPCSTVVAYKVRVTS